MERRAFATEVVVAVVVLSINVFENGPISPIFNDKSNSNSY